MNVLVTGGAGFIGTHLVRRLLKENCEVAVLDNFSGQVHGDRGDLAPDLAREVELFRGDVRDQSILSRALENRNVVVHLAAETGTGQSMYRISKYQEVNIGGTAAILDCATNQARGRLSRIVVASSRAVYGEGKYHCFEHGAVHPSGRSLKQLRAGQYEPLCPQCGAECTPLATSEDSPLQPLSFYGLTKRVQEEMILMFARERGFSAYALRYQNVYGPGQSLCNPYTGLIPIFSGLARGGAELQMFEDGKASRDFIYVADAVEATWRCMKAEGSAVEVLNVGTGQRTPIREVAEQIVQYFGSRSSILITGAVRQGDIRHNFADLANARASVDFRAEVGFAAGLQAFLSWAERFEPVTAGYEVSLREMRERGLLHG